MEQKRPSELRVPTLGFAILSLLVRGDSSGYDISRHMEQPVGFFWKVRRSQIYPELESLEEQGLVTRRRVEQRDRPDKNVYTITDEGREALARWVLEPPSIAASRDELVLKAYSLWLVDGDDAMALFAREEERHRQQVDLYERELHDLRSRFGAASAPPESPVFGNYLAVQRGIGYERGYADWCAWVIEELRRRSDGGSSKP